MSKLPLFCCLLKVFRYWGFFRKIRLMFAVTVSSNSYFEPQIRIVMLALPLLCPARVYFTTFRMWLLSWAAPLYPAKVYPAKTHVTGSSNYNQERKELMHLRYWQLGSVCHFHLILQKVTEEKKKNGQWRNKFQYQKEGLFFLMMTHNLTFISLHEKQNKTKKHPHTSGRKLEYQSSWKTASDQLINGNQAHT